MGKVKKTSRRPRKRNYKIYFLSLAFLVGVIALFAFRLNGTPCANSVSCIKDLSGKPDFSATQGEFMGKIVKAPAPATFKNPPKAVLGDSSPSNKRIYIDLTNQRLYAKEGDRTVYDFLISSGKWGRTPTGNFNIWIKLRATRMQGGNPALGTYYNLPNVPFTMYFYGSGISKARGYGIHGTYWHNNFGHPMSHGCINMKTEEAELIYNWADPQTTGYTTYASSQNPGTPITIYGNAPWD